MNINFFQTEKDNLFELDNEDLQLERFNELWTLKESFIKACGQGLSIPLDQFGFHIDPQPIKSTISQHSVNIDSELNLKNRLWKSWLCNVSHQHKLAITIGRDASIKYKLRFFETAPLLTINEISLPMEIDSAVD